MSDGIKWSIWGRRNRRGWMRANSSARIIDRRHNATIGWKMTAMTSDKKGKIVKIFRSESKNDLHVHINDDNNKHNHYRHTNLSSALSTYTN